MLMRFTDPSKRHEVIMLSFLFCLNAINIVSVFKVFKCVGVRGELVLLLNTVVRARARLTADAPRC